MGAQVLKSGMVLSGFLLHFSDMFSSQKYLPTKLELVAQAFTPNTGRCTQDDSKSEA